MENSANSFDLNKVPGFGDDDTSLELNMDFLQRTIEEIQYVRKLETINEDELIAVLGYTIYEENENSIKNPVSATNDVHSADAIIQSFGSTDYPAATADTADVTYKDFIRDQCSQVPGKFQQVASNVLPEPENSVPSLISAKVPVETANNIYMEVGDKSDQTLENTGNIGNATEKIPSSKWFAELVDDILDSDDKNQLQYQTSPQNVVNELITAEQVPNIGHHAVREAEDTYTLHPPPAVESVPYQVMASNLDINQFQLDSTTLQGLQISFQPIGYNGIPKSVVAESSVVPSRSCTMDSDKTRRAPKRKRTTNELAVNCQVGVSSYIPIYQTVCESEILNYPENRRFKCMLMVPYAPYPYEPQLRLEHAGPDKFAYRYFTEEDTNTNKRIMAIQASTSPKPPKFWCLECGISFTRSSSSYRHVKLVHKIQREIIFQISHYIQIFP